MQTSQRRSPSRAGESSASWLNDSVNQTISRTVLTSGTTLLVLIVLYLFGGDGVHGFAFTMIVGVFVGTYSSIAIAASLLLIGTGQRSEGTRSGEGEKEGSSCVATQ